MEFLKANYLQTSTSVVVGSNTSTVDNLFIRDKTFQYYSEGFNNDLTTSSITINFDETLSVSRIALLGTNVKSMNIFYNGVTANTFSFTSTSATTTSQWSTNSETSMYLEAAAVDCTSVTFDLTATQVADSEKAIGYIALTSPHFTFTRIPTAKNYKPKKIQKEVVHTLSDGGKRINRLSEKFNTKIKFKFLDQSSRDSLETVYQLKSEFMFVAFGTSTSWDEILYTVVWPGAFDFYEYSDNAQTANFSGSITLTEVSE